MHIQCLLLLICPISVSNINHILSLYRHSKTSPLPILIPIVVVLYLFVKIFYNKKSGEPHTLRLLFLTMYHRIQRTEKRHHNRRCNNCRWINISVLAPVSWCQVRTKNISTFFKNLQFMTLY